MTSEFERKNVLMPEHLDEDRKYGDYARVESEPNLLDCSWCGDEVPEDDLVYRGRDLLCDLCLDEYNQLPEDRGDDR